MHKGKNTDATGKRKGPVKALLPIILAMIFSCSFTAYANQNISLPESVEDVNVQERGSIEIELTAGGKNTSREGVTFQYTKVAEIQEGQYVLEDTYKNSGVDLNQIEYAEELDEAAEKLSFYEKTDGSCTTNEKGIAQIQDLDVGVYLLYVSDQGNYDKVMPALIAVPTWDEEEGAMLYNVKVLPKHTAPAEKKETVTESKKPIKTGDSQDLFTWITGMIAAVGITFIVLLMRRRNE